MGAAADNTKSTSLIFGCGYLGTRLAQSLLADGHKVYGTTRSTARARELSQLGVHPMLVSITQRVTFAALTPALEAESLDVYDLIPPGRPNASPTPRQVVLGGIAYTINALKHANLRRAVLTSSTAVYGQTGGAHVDADTPAEPTTQRSGILVDGEKLWLDAPLPTHVVRLAGLYGPSRVIGLSAVREGAPIVGDAMALLNLIHVDDAVALLRAMMNTPNPASIELGCDGSPTPRREYYEHLASLLHQPAPRVLDNATAAEQLGLNVQRLRRGSSKACDNIITCKRTGWTPKYTNFRDGLAAVFVEHARQRRG